MTASKATILVIDDELSIRKSIALSVRDEGHTVLEAESRREALELLAHKQFDLVITDLFVPTESDGVAILESCKHQQPEAMLLVMTAHGSIERAVSAVKVGADDFLQKGFTMAELKLRIDRLLQHRRLSEENRRLTQKYDRLRSEVENRYRFDEIIGNSKVIRDLLQSLSRVVDDRDVTVLIQGESGTGKELVARAIHYNGPREAGPFVTVNCATLPEHLLESELFGHEKGAFTGALRARPGKFEVADGGTVFIDEVGEISPEVQVKLLRFTQNRTFERVGDNRPITVDVRILTATNRDLPEAVAQGRFRQDLFYRLNVIPVDLPPLRERKGDIPLLVNHFARKFATQKGREVRFTPAALARLEQQQWPGNVRELENLVERLVVTAPQTTILPMHLPAEFLDRSERASLAVTGNETPLKDACREFEKLVILQELERNHWNITEVARILGERRDTLSRKIKRYGLKQ